MGRITIMIFDLLVTSSYPHYKAPYSDLLLQSRAFKHRPSQLWNATRLFHHGRSLDPSFTTHLRPPIPFPLATRANSMSATQKHIEKAIGQIQHKEPLPEIDFTQHQLDNGYTISTQERVVKEVGPITHFLRRCP